MKSIKSGRGPSKMEAVGGIFAAVFGIFWSIMAIVIGFWFMAPFGLIFIGLGIYSAVYNYRNSTSENRYSMFDIVDSDEEKDPLNQKYGSHEETNHDDNSADKTGTSVAYCPYCGQPVESKFDFCPKCGNKLPD